MPMHIGWHARIRSTHCAMNRLKFRSEVRDLVGMAAVALTTTLAGCATPVPGSLSAELQPFSFTVIPEARAQVWPQDNWWESFGDRQLTALIVKAREEN